MEKLTLTLDDGKTYSVEADLHVIINSRTKFLEMRDGEGKHIVLNVDKIVYIERGWRAIKGHQY